MIMTGVTKCDGFITNCDSFFLSQSVTRFITNCLRCNRVRQYTLTKHLSDTAD